MEQLTPEDIERARSVSLRAVLGLPEGYRGSIRCPFHSERTPSCKIYPDNSYHCFGCGANGQNAIDFFIELGATFPNAVRELMHL